MTPRRLVIQRIAHLAMATGLAATGTLATAQTPE